MAETTMRVALGDLDPEKTEQIIDKMVRAAERPGLCVSLDSDECGLVLTLLKEYSQIVHHVAEAISPMIPLRTDEEEEALVRRWEAARMVNVGTGEQP